MRLHGGVLEARNKDVLAWLGIGVGLAITVTCWLISNMDVIGMLKRLC